MNPPLMSGFFAAAALFCGETTFAQSVDKEPVAIVELGGAAGWNLKDGSSSFGFGFDFAAEVTPIENWLELEIGTTPLFSRRSKEWDTDVLFKKPWTLSKKAELMFGIGPEWIHTSEHGNGTNLVAGEAVLDFMFWPSARRRFGWYLEPAYEYNFGPRHERSIGLTGGLLIAIFR